MDPDTGIFGIDFVNAFGVACRECANALAGVELISSEIVYQVRVGDKESPILGSKNGTGAGRATGARVLI